MKITCLQMEMQDLTKPELFHKMKDMLRKVPPSDLIILPELWSVGFFCFDQYSNATETIEGPMIAYFKDQARKLNSYIHMGSIIEKNSKGLYNTSILINPSGTILAKYRKIHLFGYQSMEKQLLTPGDKIVMAEIDSVKVGLATCYDLRFPELFRKMVDDGVSLFLVTSAWPNARKTAWNLFNRVRAHENLSFLVACNCAGINQSTYYAGHSMIVDPSGNIIAQADEDGAILTCEIDLNDALKIRRSFPALDDRRIS